MAVIGFGSVRSCGVTTTVAALTAVWPEERRPVVVELDPAGGTLAATCGLRVTPGLVSFATASRRRMDPDAIWAHSQALPCGGAVVVGPPSAGQAQRALKLLNDSAGQLGEVDGDVLADCGRLDPTSPARAMFDRADMRVLLVRPQLPDLHHLAAWLEDTASGAAALPRVVLVGGGPYPAEEVGAALGVEVVGHLSLDAAGVARLAEAADGRTLGRSALWRAARSLARTLVEHAAPPSESPPKSLPEAASGDATVEPAETREPVSDELVGEEARS
jgi:hypothetical protein